MVIECHLLRLNTGFNSVEEYVLVSLNVTLCLSKHRSQITFWTDE